MSYIFGLELIAIVVNKTMIRCVFVEGSAVLHCHHKTFAPVKSVHSVQGKSTLLLLLGMPIILYIYLTKAFDFVFFMRVLSEDIT